MNPYENIKPLGIDYLKSMWENDSKNRLNSFTEELRNTKLNPIDTSSNMGGLNEAIVPGLGFAFSTVDAFSDKTRNNLTGEAIDDENPILESNTYRTNLARNSRGEANQNTLNSTLSSTAAGAKLGSAIIPGIGTGIGAAVGLATGLVGGLINKRKAKKKRRRARNQYLGKINKYNESVRNKSQDDIESEKNIRNMSTGGFNTSIYNLI